MTSKTRMAMSNTGWHRFWGFQTSMKGDNGCKKRKRAPFESEAKKAWIDGWSQLRKMGMVTQL